MDLEHSVILHDGTFDGLLHGVAAAIKSKKKVLGIYAATDYQAQLFVSEVHIKTDRQQAEKLLTYLHTRGGKAAKYALDGFLSEDKAVGTHLFLMVREILDKGGLFSQCYTHDSVRYLAQLSEKVLKEAHRFTGLIRFRVLDEGVQYGPFEPDFNVIGYCARHFQQRLSNTKWILHDLHRDLAVFWDCRSLREIQIDQKLIDCLKQSGEIPANMLNSSEVYYQKLWKLFHHSIANQKRKNEQLQRQHMPARYWRYLVEHP